MSKIFVGMKMLEAVVFAIGIIVANVPEGLSSDAHDVALGGRSADGEAQRAREEALGVETLGSTTVICTDKTGTLTANQMTVREVWLPGMAVQVEGVGYAPEGGFALDGKSITGDAKSRLDGLLAAAALCNNARLKPPATESDPWSIIGDPTEAAMLVSAAKAGFDIEELEDERPRRYEFPFDSSRKRMTVVCDVKGKLVAYAKGAPKETIELCTHVSTADGRSSHHRLPTRPPRSPPTTASRVRPSALSLSPSVLSKRARIPRTSRPWSRSSRCSASKRCRTRLDPR